MYANKKQLSNKIDREKNNNQLESINGTAALQLTSHPVVDSKQFIDLIKQDGWQEESFGQYRSSGQVKQREGYLLFSRKRNLNDFVYDFQNKSYRDKPQNHLISRAEDKGSNTTMGIPKAELTPGSGSDVMKLPVLSSLTDYQSILAARKDKPCLLIGYDAEWDSLDYDRKMLSWQFAFVDDACLTELVFISTGNDVLPLMDAIGYILDYIGKFKAFNKRTMQRYKYCVDWDDGQPVELITKDADVACRNCKYVYRSGVGFTKEEIQKMPDKSCKRSERNWSWFHSYYDYSAVESINVCLVCHAGKGDLSGVSYSDRNPLLTHLSEIQGGLVSLYPVKYLVKSLSHVNNTYIYPISLSVSDTMCHAPDSHKKLEDLGNVLGIEKIKIDDEQKKHMSQLLASDPNLYMEYASRDSIVTVLYASALYGYNNAIPVTLTSAAAQVMKEKMMKSLNTASNKDFNRVYRGLESVSHGKYKMPDKPTYLESSSLEPISNDVSAVQLYASQAYHGGYNICTEVGCFPYLTYDYDLQNAYPTAMCLVPDIDWENPIENEIIHRELTLADFTVDGITDPITPFVGYVSFEFPTDCKYPCIPVNVDGIPVYPLSSEGLNGVYAAGPYIWLALKLGAHVYCDRGYFLRVLYTAPSGEVSRCLGTAVKQLVNDRSLAKAEKGKKSLEELTLKMLVNSGYGKVAQNVIKKTAWSAYKDLMEDLGCSAITNPVSAMMTTSIVQVVLIAAQNQIHKLGYMSCSVTTDGFISNCPESILKNLNLFGLREYIEESRIYLTGNDPCFWEIKHHQDDLVNFTTRGNVSLHCEKRDGYDGVCAHNGAKSGVDKKNNPYEDRFWLMTQVLGRAGKVKSVVKQWPSLKELVHGNPFEIKEVTSGIKMDFDMKRKPDRDSFTTDKVLIEDKVYQIAHFDTVPYKNIEEFRLYRSKKDLTVVLRTEADWNIFWYKLENHTSASKPRNLEWSILTSCVMGHRMGLWNFPSLNDKSVEERCEWINSHNTSGKVFRPDDWKNARKPERQSSMLPLEVIEEKRLELLNDTY